ncbi:MAG: NAD(P)-dependent oxidoreductase, partial [Pseudomonadota bacterium]|nr:NAD(P)-dependent oxidoreductase [Pseudomonadota bacterium]
MLQEVAELVVASAPDRQTILAEGRGADIVIVRAPLPEALFESPGNLRAAIRHGAGLDMIPVGAATAAGVLVANVPGVNAATVAEHVFMASMILLRRFRQVDGDLRAHGWEAVRAHSGRGHDLGGRVMGIVGMGNVGKAVAAIAQGGFGLQTIAHVRNPDSLPSGVKGVELDLLLGESDIVVLCCPLTAATRGLIDAARIARMKQGAIL